MNTLVDRTLASTLPVGTVSALNYSNKLISFVVAIFITSISSVIYPILSQLSHDNNKERFISSVIKSINCVIILILPITVGTMVLSLPIVRVLFERGAFDERGTSLTAIALTMYSIGMVAYGLRDVLGKIFYSLQDTKTPMVNGVIAMGVNMVMDVVFIKFWGLGGLTLATSLSSMACIMLLFRSLKKKIGVIAMGVNMVMDVVFIKFWGLGGLTLATSLSSMACIMLLFRSLKKKIGYFGQDKIVKATVKSLVASLVMGVVSYYSYNYMMRFTHTGGESEFFVLCVAIVLGAAIYGGLVILFKVDEIRIVTDVVKRKLSKKS